MWHLLRAVVALAALGAVAAPTATAALPPGYHRQFATFTAKPSSLGSGGDITCPAGTVPWGGGTVYSGGIPGVGNSINSSFPTQSGWRARYNNTTSTVDDFRVSVICASRPARYTITFATVANPAVTTSSATVSCPTGTVLLNGGVQSTSESASTFLLGAWPVNTHKYKAVVWNGSDAAAQVTAFAVCGRKPAGYELNSAVSTPTQGPSTIVGGSQCTGRKQIIGGGIKVGNPIPDIALGGSIDEPAMQWLYELVANTTSTVTSTVYAICVG